MGEGCGGGVSISQKQVVVVASVTVVVDVCVVVEVMVVAGRPGGMYRRLSASACFCSSRVSFRDRVWNVVTRTHPPGSDAYIPTMNENKSGTVLFLTL